jgi:type VI secretion system protein ImpE
MAQVCRAALQCEALRAEVFAGQRTPLVFGQPPAWVGLLVEANRLAGQGKVRPAQSLRQQAFDAAPASAGSIDGQRFEWIADADSRLGPMFEGIIEGKYYWIPVCNVAQLLIDKPADLRDMVWTPATFVWANGGNSMGLIPTRYPGSESSADSAILLARKTEWRDLGGGLFAGLGQRMLATDVAEYPLLATRAITMVPPQAAPPAEG